MSVTKEAQVESLFDRLKFRISKKKREGVAEGNIDKSELVGEESGENIDELFVKLYGEPSQPISAEEQQEILQRKKSGGAEGETPDAVEDSEKASSVSSDKAADATERKLVEEDNVQPETATVEHGAELNLDDLFEEMGNSKGDEKPPPQNEKRSCVLL